MADKRSSTHNVTNPRLDLSAEDVRTRFDYDPETGHFSRKGRRIGWLHPATGYRYISVGRVAYKEHRLAWLHFYGEWPKGQVDHINRNRTDNAIRNLRDVNGSMNQANVSKNAANTTGFRGVVFKKDLGKYMAQIRHKGIRLHLGYFDTPEEASKAYEAAFQARQHALNNAKD